MYADTQGMPASTLRRHLAVLVDAGLIVRRDSPNGKRYARKNRAGAIELAFGFDLSPLVVRSDGGYLRKSTRKAGEGEFSLGPILIPQINAKNRERRWIWACKARSPDPLRSSE